MNVLILTDFSAQAYNAARYALNLTSGSSKFYVLHASNGEAAQVEESLLELVDNLKEQPQAVNHDFSALPFSDNLIYATRKAVLEKRIDLIVMGASGKNTSNFQGLGGNTCSVAKKVKCPVLVVPNCDFKQWERLYLPLDLRFPVNTKALQLLEKLPVVENVALNVWEFDLNDSGAKIDNFNLVNYQIERQTLKRESDFLEKFWPEATVKANLILFFARQLHITEKLLNRLSTVETRKQNLPVLILHE
ncbi:Nucleotide-binding universal stress protein, UspA family [Salegentibacter holothuriorum]|uniref:Nucleotide-binding universal stress protein, UspA family n=1 Tax=Salegentibacter holothuriorum TaxID=241145 RepID=A0A1T5C6U6_9FLAO|nr:universal stress protein [Salegentibacter holothuriorum]SKB55069.1 Nucleotide-binding universal stress protein, UspA family [Salegentibacter holothuriorum]